jgi:hypothetical protein
MSNLISLQNLIEKEHFILCSFLTTNEFISYCKDRSINTSREQLEQLEKLGIFFPIARVKIPKIKIKIEYIDNGTRYKDLGILNDGEVWQGDVKEEYAHFWFEKSYADNWLNEGILWDPHTRDFEDWDNFYDEDKREFVVSYYSIFQCYTLYNLTTGLTRMELRAEWCYTYSEKDVERLTDRISKWAKQVIELHKKTGTRGEVAPIICQVLSNRYFPKTQTDRRTISLSISSYYHDWDWNEYCQKWDSKSALEDLSLSIDDIKQIHQLLLIDARSIDPLEQWYGLVNFVSLEQKRKLKGKALLAQLVYSMEHMVRLFYKELTGETLFPPDENISWKKDDFYGEGVTDNDLQYLEFLTNQYHLNPKPKLILIVEGNGEETQFPRLSEELFGLSFPKLGVEVVNISGVAGFTGRKGFDRYGALEKFIDYYHNRQTIVFVVLDNEGRTEIIKNKLINAPSKYYKNRFVTKSEYIHLWKQKTIEFENFSLEEIAHAMSKINTGEYVFTPVDIENSKQESKEKSSDHLSRLYREKTGYDLPKPELLKTLFDDIIANADNEFDSNKEPVRPITQLIHRIIKLASMNHQPTCLETWKKNQDSGYFGDIKE